MSKAQRVLKALEKTRTLSSEAGGKEFQAMSVQIFDFQKKISAYMDMAKKAKLDDVHKSLKDIDGKLDTLRRNLFSVKG